MNVVGDDADELVDGEMQPLPLCHGCTRSFGCLSDVVVDLWCCSCLMLNWKM